MIIAILSTSVMPKDGVYKIETVSRHKLTLDSIPHYIGHPCTKKIVESLGAIKAVHSNFKGLRVGESAICCPIRHNKENHRKHRYTRANQFVGVDDLLFRVLTRIS